jgi:hypothetical protein
MSELKTVEFIPTRFPNGSIYYRVEWYGEGEASQDSISM